MPFRARASPVRVDDPALARPALARAPPLTACPSAQVNPPAGATGTSPSASRSSQACHRSAWRTRAASSWRASPAPPAAAHAPALSECVSPSRARPRSERPIANRLRRSGTPPPSTTSPTAQWSNLQRFPMSKRWCAQSRTQQLWMHRRSASKIPFPTAAPPQENRWTRAFSQPFPGRGQPFPGRGPSLVAGRPRGSAGRRNSPPAPCALLTSSWRCDALRTATSSGRLRTPTPPTGRSRSGGTRQLYPAIARSLGPRCFHANLDSRRAPPPASSSPPLRPHATLTLTPPRRRPSATSSSSSRRAPSLARARASPHAPRRIAPPGGHPRAPRCPACQLHRLVRAPSSTPCPLPLTRAAAPCPRRDSGSGSC